MSTEKYVITNFHQRITNLVDSKLSGNWADLARRAGLRPSTLQQVKDGADPRVSTLLRIADGLDVSVGWLLTGEGPMHRIQPEPEPAKPAELPKKPVLRLVEIVRRPDNRLAMMLTWLESWWERANSDERVWCDIQMTRCFPEYKDYRQAAENENGLEGDLDGSG